MWPLGALAELLDNSQDRECGSTRVEVDAYVLNPSRDKGGYCITVQDDGVGMDRARLNNMLSFGFSDKEHLSGNVGRFGIGFKSGSMRLADDALILTKRDGMAHCALLSQSFLDAIGADDILIPMFSWKMEDGGRYVASEPTDATEWSSNMAIIENYCFTKSEKELLTEMDKIQGSHGTRVVLFNLRKREGESNGEGEREHEFDFSVGNDIRMLGDTEDKNNRGLSSKNTSRRPVFQQHRDGQQATLDVPEDYSLRAYMEVLYLRPRCAFYLRGEKIQPRCPISRLTKEYYVFPEYKPKGLAYGITVHCGYIEENSKLCGFHIYNKNRLIRLYQRFASQLQANCMMKDMLGVIEADCLEPTHNKQAFKESDMAYHRMKKHVTQCMNDYYFGVQNLRSAGKNGRERVVGKAVTRPKGKLSLGKKRKQAATDIIEDAPGAGADTEDSKLMNAAKANRPINRYKAILQRLMSDRNAFPFLEKVDPIALDIPDYLDIISHPMDFGTIFKRLEPEDEHGVPLETTYYTDSDPSKFANDVRLVFANAFTYNKPSELVYVQAEKLAQLFEREWVYKFPSSAYGAGGSLQPEMLKNKIKNLLETEKMLKKNANKKRKKMAAAAAAAAAEVKKEQPTGDVLKTENGTATADANGEAAKATPMEVEGEDLEDGDDDDDDDDEGPANPDDELNVQIVLDTYDDAAKKKWMEAQVEEVLEMKQKMRNQSTIVIEQQTKIANLEQNLKNAIQDLDVASLKRGSKGSKKQVDAANSHIVNQLAEARQQIIDQRLRIQKLQKAAQVRNGNTLNQAIQPVPAGLENLAKQGEQNQIIRMDDANIGVEQKELLQALHAATDKLEKQYTLLQLERQRAKGLEEKLKEEHDKAQQIQRLIGNSGAN